MPGDASDRPYAGRFVDGEHRYALRVFYEDTDAGGVVYHANYLRYFERARSDMMTLAGADQSTVQPGEEGGYVVAEVQLRYVTPARLRDVLVIHSSVADLRNSACVVQQRVMRDGQLVADGRLRMVYVGPGGRPRRQPAAWIEAFRAMTGA